MKFQNLRVVIMQFSLRSSSELEKILYEFNFSQVDGAIESRVLQEVRFSRRLRD